jgi:thiol-disulfide isomerase/thioredoxin
MLKVSLLSSLIAISLLFKACSSEKKEQKSQNKTLKVMPKDEITLTSIDNTDYILKKTKDGFKLKNSKEQLLILDIFATWCPPCQAEAPHLSALQKKYKQKIKVIGISIEDNIPNEKLEAFKKNFNANYTLVNSPKNRELIDNIADKLQLGRNFGIPLLVIYKDGKLVHYYQGAVEEEFIDSDIKKALEI